MVGTHATPKRSYSLEQVLLENHVHSIITQCVGEDVPYQLIGNEVKPAIEGLSGFLGDHIRCTLHVQVGSDVKVIPLFVKRIPMENQPKADFIDDHNYFRREMLMFKLLDEMKGAEGPNKWCAKAYVYTDNVVVMPDLAAEGFSIRPLLETLDLPHTMLTVASIARYHAAFANYETNKTTDPSQPYSIYNEYSDILTEPTFYDSPWLRTAAKLTADFLDAFSTKYNKNIPKLEQKLAKSFIEACDSLTVYEDTLNVMVHKDLWVNNIMFKYENDMPTNALLIDYQCVRYGPPTFDLMVFLYLNTTKSFRDKFETEIFHYYYSVFSGSLEEGTKKRLKNLGYDEKAFMIWCEKSRMFGIVETITISSQVLMDPQSAQETYDNPDTFMKIVCEDRSEPVIKYARRCAPYKERQLEVNEEFVERYILKQL